MKKVVMCDVKSLEKMAQNDPKKKKLNTKVSSKNKWTMMNPNWH
jgi:hypothetical protein